MVSYFKTQWWRLLFAASCFGVAIYFALQPAPDISTLEGVNVVTGYMFASICWLLSAFVWLGMSIVDWYDDRVTLLEKKQERDDAMFELVQELLKANKIDREIMKKYEDRLKKLEDMK